MAQRSIPGFIVAVSSMLFIAHAAGPANAQEAYAPAEAELNAEAYASDGWPMAVEAPAEGGAEENGGYVGNDDGESSSAPAPCCADSASGDTAPDTSPELMPWAGQTESAGGNGIPALSWEDREAIGRVAYAEAGNQGEEGIAAVIFTILNRVSSGQFQDSVQGVIEAPNQFEPVTRAGGWRYLPPLDTARSIQFETILNLIPDPTQGALFFQNARIVAARAAAGRVSPYLVDFGGTPPVAEIRDHRFYDARAAANLAFARLRTRAEDTASAIDGLAYPSEGDYEYPPAQPEWSDPSLPAEMSEESSSSWAPAQDDEPPPG